jgi:cytochrome c
LPIVLGCAALAALLPSIVRPLTAGDSGGKQTFEKRCTGCHALDAERVGPSLRGVYGRHAASLTGFQYSEALRKSGITWDSATLDKWLSGPDALVPDNDMAFRVANPQERAAIIGYLKDLSGK